MITVNTDTRDIHTYVKAFERFSIFLVPSLGISLPFRQAFALSINYCEGDALITLTC